MIDYKELNIMSFGMLNNQGVINFFAYMPYNFRREQIDQYKINKQIDEISKNINMKFKKIVKPHQTHTNKVVAIDSSNLNDEFNNVDGLVTNLKEVGLAISTADCQSILFYDPKKQVIGNVHSGWMGTLNRISTNLIQLMIDKYECNPIDIQVYIEPSILKCCFEVDEDVKQKFEDEFKDININQFIEVGNIKEYKQKYFIDTVGINKQVLINLGSKDENIVLSNICSKCNSNYIHSHRADGNSSGRNLSVICLK